MSSLTAAEWDRRYQGQDLVWSSPPNMWVEQETRHLNPGRALDLACGEGRNSVWLARQGWRVTGTDFSAVGLDKARALAASQPPSAEAIQWLQADATSFESETVFDLALLVYLQLPHTQRRSAIRAAWQALAPSGTLLVIAHHVDNLPQGVGGPQDAATLYTEQDVLDDLAAIGAAEVRRAARVDRPVPGHDRPALDTLVGAVKPHPVASLPKTAANGKADG